MKSVTKFEFEIDKTGNIKLPVRNILSIECEYETKAMIHNSLDEHNYKEDDMIPLTVIVYILEDEVSTDTSYQIRDILVDDAEDLIDSTKELIDNIDLFI